MPDYSIGRYLVYTRDVSRSGELVPGELPMAISKDTLQAAMTAASSVLGVASWVRVFDCHLGQLVDISEPDNNTSAYFANAYFPASYFGGLGG